MLGKPVPDFSLPSTGGVAFHRSTTRGSKVVLYFYPLYAGFNAKMKFPFELLSDPNQAVCEQFGVMQQQTSCYAKKVRGIKKGWRGVEVPGHAQEVLNFVKAL